MRIVVTGASGFIGRAVIEEGARSPDVEILPVSRRAVKVGALGVTTYGMGNDFDPKQWATLLTGADSVVHLAGRAHFVRDPASNPLAEHRRINTLGTLAMAKLAAEFQVRRFIFVSSIGVLGESSETPFTEQTPPSPVGPYAQSKREAESMLREFESTSGMEIVIVRPPLVYGPGCPGNFASLLRLVHSGIPLPLGSINNSRNFIGVNNLANFLLCAACHPKAGGKDYLVADRESISTPALIRSLAAGMKRPARLFPVPYEILNGLTGLFGKTQTLSKLCGNLEIDSSKARTELDWTQPMGLSEGLCKTAEWYRSSHS